ncbi:hypothetical protein DCAR_0415813 [Daucus carota subsp. sativus]|uniref:Uncharacterized protein n=1 Tax=Daucus carota subsp. sativus TaxID=79200 RepID=A0A175YAH4_DAUCS|nr:PREDICTED: zinc finger protein ZAT5-like [Daucus carota subsp. sativus]WOG96478.1 hypothetical protein DCAR_0415813 [Daucus carota subsp. sativus]
MGSEEYYNMMMIKGKRSKRQRQLLAASSSALALTMAASSSSTSSSDQQFNNNICVMNCDDDKNTTQVEQDTANCLILLAQGGQSPQNLPTTTTAVKDSSMYQCKTCDRSFPSFQALGGHRASHKRPKPGSTTDPALINHHESSSSMFNHDTNNTYTTNTTLSLQISPSRPDSCSVKISNTTKSSSKVHECSICGAEFTSGQALGGHMRRHRSSLLPRASPNHESDNEPKKPAAANVFSLDLNLPAPEDMDQPIESKFPFAMNEQVIVFSPSALVDCHL